MGPLAPNELISENTNFLFAFLIGIAFGFVLESSGFSSSRKLAGQFYGYDTVVLKVFFTGAITCMLGLLFMSLFGWIDLDLVYVNPTYLTSAIVGGVVMGAGFIMGGFCPGTSFCGAAIGKIDGMVFVGGLFLGIYGFAFHLRLVGETVYGKLSWGTKNQYITWAFRRLIRINSYSDCTGNVRGLQNGLRRNSPRKHIDF